MNTSQIKVHVNVCESAKPFTFRGKSFAPGHKGHIDLAMSVLAGDILELAEIPNHPGAKPRVGGASEIHGISIRICESKTSVIAVYKNVEKNMDGCCACGDCGVCVYGDSGCDPGCP